MNMQTNNYAEWMTLVETRFRAFDHCAGAGFPSAVTVAFLALLDDDDLLEATHDTWHEWDAGNNEDFCNAVRCVIGADCVFCQECKELTWTDDSTRVADGDRVCQDCIENYSSCTHCEEWYGETTTVGDRRYCDDCLSDQCSYCDACDEYVAEDTTSVQERSYCDHCLRNACTYCEPCSEWYEDGDDSHDHEEEGCGCSAEHFNFKFPADGHGLIQQDERLTIELPKGTIDSEGIARIKRLLHEEVGWQHSYIVEDAVESVGPIWQTKRGNFTRRLSSALHKHGVKLKPEVISEVGNLAQAHSSAGATWHIEFTRDLNQSAESFYHDDSCWWGSYYASRCALKSWGGIGLRTYTDSDDSTDYPSGRIWVQPLRRTDSGLQPTHDTLGADAYVLFNGYGDLSGYAAARIVAHLAGRTYRKIELSADKQYVNNGAGYLVADEATCEDTETLYFGYDEHDQQDAHTYLSKKEETAA